MWSNVRSVLTIILFVSYVDHSVYILIRVILDSRISVLLIALFVVVDSNMVIIMPMSIRSSTRPSMAL